jgi:hypothetical protein
MCAVACTYQQLSRQHTARSTCSNSDALAVAFYSCMFVGGASGVQLHQRLSFTTLRLHFQTVLLQGHWPHTSLC